MLKENQTEKPTVRLIGHDGNAFAIMGACKRAAKEAGWSKEHIDEYLKQAMSGDYDHLLATTMTFFDVH